MMDDMDDLAVVEAGRLWGEGSAEAEEPSKKGVGQDASEGASESASEGILEEEHVTLN